MRDWIKNEHGVEGQYESSGYYYGRRVANTDGTTTVRVNQPVFIPRCCFECPNFDPGEYGDYGSKLSPPYCEANVWFPTRKGTCRTGELAREDRLPAYAPWESMA